MLIPDFHRKAGPINFDDSDWIVVLVGAALGAFVQLYVEKKFGARK